MPSLRDTLKELYDGVMEEARTNPQVMRGGVTIGAAQAEAARLYAAALAKARGEAAPAPAPAMYPVVAPETAPSVEPTVRSASVPPVAPSSAPPVSREAGLHPALAGLTADRLIQGVLLSEVLGPPVCRRGGHGRIVR